MENFDNKMTISTMKQLLNKQGQIVFVFPDFTLLNKIVIDLWPTIMRYWETAQKAINISNTSRALCMHYIDINICIECVHQTLCVHFLRKTLCTKCVLK